MFLGEYTHTIDDKGRVTIPAKFRGELAAGLVVSRGFDRNLMVFPKDEWLALAAKIAERPQGDEKVRAFRRRVFSGADDVTPDRQGRIIIPQHLRDFAGLDGEVVITGNLDYIELWNAETWQNELESIEDNNDARRWEDLGV